MLQASPFFHSGRRAINRSVCSRPQTSTQFVLEACRPKVANRLLQMGLSRIYVHPCLCVCVDAGKNLAYITVLASLLRCGDRLKDSFQRVSMHKRGPIETQTPPPSPLQGNKYDGSGCHSKAKCSATVAFYELDIID